MIQTTTWSPDTCGCTVHYQWDDSILQDQRVHIPIDSVISHDSTIIPTTKCQYHQIDDVYALHDVLNEENPRKNKMISHLVANFPALTKTDEKGNVLLKDDVINWSFDSNRVLNITIPSLTKNEKIVLKTDLDTKLGNGKVNIDG